MTDQESFERRVEASFRWNFVVNLLDITFIMFGLNLVSQSTIMPLLVSELTTSKVAIGLIPATYNLSYLLPQLLTANFAGGLRRNKPFVMLLGSLGERLPYLLIGLVVWWLAVPAPAVALVAFFMLLATSAASNGTATPAWYSMIAKVIPVHRRGLWSGLGRSLGAFLGIAGAQVAERILESRPFPRNYGLCFVLAFISAAISWVGPRSLEGRRLPRSRARLADRTAGPTALPPARRRPCSRRRRPAWAFPSTSISAA
jgi:sugar phosphate permease